MSKYINFLVSRVQSYITSELSTNSDSNFRSVFAGPPENMLDDVLKGLVNEGLMKVNVDGKQEDVVVLLPTKTDNNPEGISSGRCSQGYQVSVRNSSVKHILTLQPPDEEQIKSIRSTVTRFGVSPLGFTNAKAWIEDDFVNELLLQVVRIRDFPDGEIPEWLLGVMKKFAELDEEDGHTDFKWTVVRRLFDQPASKCKHGNFLVAFAATGLVKPSRIEKNYEDLISLVDEIGDFFQREGLVAGLQHLIECAERLSDEDHKIDKIIGALKQFEEHVLKVAKTAPGFASAALRHYCPYKETGFQEEIPAWWHTLDEDIWRTLLDYKSPPSSRIKVIVTNQVTRSSTKSLPAVTDNEIEFEISVAKGTLRPEIVVTRREGRRKATKIGTINSGFGNTQFSDRSVPTHAVPLVYTFEPSDRGIKAVSVKAVELSSFEPGFIVDSRGAIKITLPRKVKSKEYETIYECDLELNGQGYHQVDLFTHVDFKINSEIYGYGVTTDDDDDNERTFWPVQVRPRRWNFDAETDEECRYEFDYLLSNRKRIRARLNLRAGDVLPAGAGSEFHRLSIEVSLGQSARIALRENQLVYSLQRWMLDDKNSFRPLLVSPSFEGNYDIPNWNSNPIWSAHPPVYDPRPGVEEFSPPSELVDIRHSISQMIKSEQGNGLCELAQLGKMYLHDGNFRTLVDEYVGKYVEWLDEDYTKAALFDTVLVCFYQRDSEVLQPAPIAILLSPLHPARLGWHVIAQTLFVDALSRGIRCPGASVIDPTSLPDAMAFPVVKAQGDTEFMPFVSIPCNSDYWTVLWNAKELDRVGSIETKKLFCADFGITLSGLSSGFSKAQVKRTLQELYDVNAGRSRLRIRLLTDAEGMNDTDAGINDWALENLGRNDPWHTSSRVSMDIIDARGCSQTPAEPFVANLTSKTQGAARWLTDEKTNFQVDLSLIAHLKRITPEPYISGAYSAVSLGSLTRERVCYKLPTANSQMVGESRALSNLTPTTLGKDVDSLASSIELIDWRFESAMAEKCSVNSISFAPNIPTLERGLEASAYCAVSSADIDSSAFFRSQHGSYLWDYDLPSYAGNARENVGYYLLAKHSTEIEKQIGRTFMQIGGYELEEHIARELLSEISRRGLPSVKEFASGGTSAIGSIGLLVACRLLQGPPDIEDDVPRLLPLIADNGQTLNIILPIDPFTAQFNDLRKALGMNNFQRPDLLVASIRLDAQFPVSVRLTPIEVKARTRVMSAELRRMALEQAKSFSNFLVNLLAKTKEEPVWQLAVTKFMATWFSFGFRIYGEIVPAGFRDNLMKCNAAVNQALLRGTLTCDVDVRGRLVVIHSGGTSHATDLDDDRFEETMSIKPDDALGIIFSPESSSVLQGVVGRLGNWDLLASNVGVGHITPPEISPKSKVVNSDKLIQPIDSEQDSSETNITADSMVLVPQLDIIKSTNETEIEATGIHFKVGTTLDSFSEESRNFFPGNTQLTQLNIGIVGNLGTGKTQLTKSLIYQVSRGEQENFNLRPFFLIFDYKHDYVDIEFLETLGAKVIKPRHIPINIFDTSTVPGETPAWLERSNFLCDVLAKIYSGIGPVQRENLKQSVKNAYQAAELNKKNAPTLTNVFSEYRQLVQKPDSVFSILSDMVDMELFEDNSEHIVPSSNFQSFPIEK